VLLAAIAERTKRVRLFTTLTTISVLDPVRVAEDYATVDQLSQGRLEIMVGKGNDPRHFPLFGLDPELQWDYQDENYELLRRLWTEEDVTWSGRFRPSLSGVTTEPRPFQQPPTIWHGSASSERSTELAARFGDPIFSANGFHLKAKYAALIDHYRARWEAYGRDPADAVVGSGAGGLYVARTSQEARDRFRPYYDVLSRTAAALHNQSPFTSLDDAIERGSMLVGSPQEVIDKIGDYHATFGHEIQGLAVDGLSTTEQRDILELVAAEVAPVLRREIPTRLWAGGAAVREPVAVGARSAVDPHIGGPQL
jgi:alkanesulfonate monooxygenase SsuD/methylene tetrahydromethanopterin reductase-like flavin-dependent oxidoreductase (luciferase family)